jgi:hypothetical protein
MRHSQQKEDTMSIFDKWAEEYRNSASYRTSEQIEADHQAKLARIASEKAAFTAKADAHYASLSEKSQNEDWQQEAYRVLGQQDMGWIYAAIRTFSSSPFEGEGRTLVDAGLAERHTVNGSNHYLLTEKGYMVVWARGTRYFPNTTMEGL